MLHFLINGIIVVGPADLLGGILSSQSSLLTPEQSAPRSLIKRDKNENILNSGSRLNLNGSGARVTSAPVNSNRGNGFPLNGSFAANTATMPGWSFKKIIFFGFGKL